MPETPITMRALSTISPRLSSRSGMPVRPLRPGTGLGTGGNLPKPFPMLSAWPRSPSALTAMPMLPYRWRAARMLAAEALVCHRPGTWEADHVRALTFPPDLISPPRP